MKISRNFANFATLKLKISKYIRILIFTKIILPIFWYFGPWRNQNESWNILTPKSAARTWSASAAARPAAARSAAPLSSLSSDPPEVGTFPSTQSLTRVSVGGRCLSVVTWVERFDRRGTEPFELFRSEFGQKSFKIQEIALKIPKFQKNSFNFSSKNFQIVRF